MNKGPLLGAAIRAFRQRRRQYHNTKPWSLDDLAAETGADKAHLSRIERGTISPNRATLLRIAAALELSRPETEFLLRLAGLGPLFDPPSSQAAKTAIRWLARHSRFYLLPFTLYSVDMRVWYSNALWLRLMNLTPERFRTCMEGRHLAQGHLGPNSTCTTAALIKNRYHDYDDVWRRTVTRYRADMIQGHIPEDIVSALLKDSEFATLWSASEVHLPQYSLSGEQGSCEMSYPGQGLLRFDTWLCPLQMDHRFLVIFHHPRDLHTREAINAIRRDPRPTAGLPCALHGYTPETRSVRLAKHAKPITIIRR